MNSPIFKVGGDWYNVTAFQKKFDLLIHNSAVCQLLIDRHTGF